MIAVITAYVENALISYIKQIEAITPADYQLGLFELLNRATRIHGHRRTDVEMIHALCERALRTYQSPQSFIQEVFQYLQTIKTGFLFFSGKSRLRHTVYQAIDQYDLRYLAYQSGQVQLMERSLISDSANPTDQPVYRSRPQPLNPGRLDSHERPEQQRAETSLDQSILRGANSPAGAATEALSEMRQELSLVYDENLHLHEELRRLQERLGAAAATVVPMVAANLVDFTVELQPEGSAPPTLHSSGNRG